MDPVRGALIVGAGGVVAYLAARPSAHYSWADLTQTSSKHGNIPTPAAMIRLVLLARLIGEPLWEQFGFKATSGYRSPAVNAATPGSSSKSYHLSGAAMDGYSTQGATLDEMATWLWYSDLPLAEVILEREDGHLHVALDAANLLRGEGYRRRFYETWDEETYDPWSPE